MRGILVACALAAGCIEDAAPVQPAPVVPPDPHKMISDMLATYASAKTYVDHGSVVTEFIRPGRNFTRRLAFDTAVVRGDKFRFELRDETRASFRYTIWSDGTHTFTRSSVFANVVDDGPDLSLALGAAAGVSERSSTAVPAMLLPTVGATEFSMYRELHVLGAEQVAGHSCWHLETTSVRGDLGEVWIDQASHVLRRLLRRHHFGPESRGGEFDTVTTLSFEPSVGQPVDVALLEPPDLSGGVAPRAPMHTIGVFADAGTPRVKAVLPGSPAERAGIRTGDVIVSLQGNAVSGEMDLLRPLQNIAIGSSVTLVLQRDGTSFEVTLVVEALPTRLPTAATAAPAAPALPPGP